jgi:hypothetical protein
MIVLLKLTDGSDVIGRIIHETEEEISLDDVMRVSFNFPRFDMPPVIYCQKWSPFVYTYDATFKQIHIINQTENIDPVIIDYYEEMLEYTKENFKLIVKSALEDEIEETEIEEEILFKKKDLH